MVALIFFLILMAAGVFLWWRCAGKLIEAGRIMFFCALLGICLGAVPHIPTISDSRGGAASRGR